MINDLFSISGSISTAFSSSTMKSFSGTEVPLLATYCPKIGVLATVDCIRSQGASPRCGSSTKKINTLQRNSISLQGILFLPATLRRHPSGIRRGEGEVKGQNSIPKGWDLVLFSLPFMAS